MSTLKPLQIDIVSDVVCPWCYIGKRRIENALALTPDQTYLLVLDTQSGDVTVIQKRTPRGTLETSEYSLMTLIPVGMQPNAIVVKAFLMSTKK